MPIEMKPVTSSQIEAIGFDWDNHVLHIQFKAKGTMPGSLYRYAKIEPEKYLAFDSAASVGTFFGKEIKPFPEKYPFARIDLQGALDIIGKATDLDKLTGYMEMLPEETRIDFRVEKAFSEAMKRIKGAQHAH